jgi:hypothetical protein
MFKKYPWVAIAARNGLIAGVVGMIMLVGLYYLGRHPFSIPPYMDFRIILFGVLLFFTLKEFRDYFQQGTLYFWQGMFMSLIFTTIFAFIAFLVIWGFAGWSPRFVSSYISLTLDQIKSMPAEIIERIGKTEYDRSIKALPFTRGIDLASLYFWQSFVISFFVSILISVILRRQPKT